MQQFPLSPETIEQFCTDNLPDENNQSSELVTNLSEIT